MKTEIESHENIENSKYINKGNLANRTISGLLWMSSGAGLESLLKFVVLIIMSRLLTPEDFGIVGAALVVISFASIISMLGVGPSLVQRNFLTDDIISTAFSISVILNFIIALLVFVFAPVFAIFFKMGDLVIIIRVISLIFIFQGFSNVAESLLQRELRFRELAHIQVVSFIAYSIVGISLAFLGYGLWSLVYANIIQSLVKSIFTVKLKPHPKKILINPKTSKDMIIFGGGFSLAKLSNQFALQGDNLVVGRYLGAESLGLYSRAYQLMVMPTSLFGRVLDRVLFPTMAKVKNNRVKLSKVYKSGLILVSFLMLPISTVFLLLSNEIVILILGKGWQELDTPFQILACGLLFRTSYKISDALARAKGVVYQSAFRQIMYAFFVIFGAWCGQFWGIVGVSVGTLVAITINFLTMTQLSLKLTGITWRRFVDLHIPSIRFSILFGIFLYICKQIFIDFKLPLLLMVIIILLISILLSVAFSVLFPRIIIGRELLSFINPYLNTIFNKIKNIKYIK